MCIIQQLILSSSIQPHQKVERLCEPLRDIQSAPTLTPESPPPPLPPRKGGGGGGRGSSFIKSFASLLRSEVNSELNFPPKLRGARSRLYRRRFLQVNTRWKALAEIYTMDLSRIPR